MPKFGNSRNSGAGWRRQATMMVVVGALAIAAQGCCSLCSQPATHSVAFGVDTAKCPCPDATCVCPVPDVIKVHRGDRVQFVNASPYTVTITPAVPTAFDQGSPIVIAPKTVVTVTVSNNVAVDVEIRLNMAISAPGTMCPGLAGPRMDVERG